jgi:hypothetical protein
LPVIGNGAAYFAVLVWLIFNETILITLLEEAMLIDVEFFTKPLTALWNFFMSDKPVVIESTEYMPTGLWGKLVHVVYTLELPEDHPKRIAGRSTREAYRTYDMAGGSGVAQSYQQMFFVLPQYEGDKFLEAPNELSIRDSAVDSDVARAIRAFDDDNTNGAQKSFSNKQKPVAGGRVQQAATSTCN